MPWLSSYTYHGVTYNRGDTIWVEGDSWAGATGAASYNSDADFSQRAFYGFYKYDDGYIAITIKADKDISKVDGHWKFYKTNGQFTSYLMIKSSSQYDTAEMSHFIEQVVIEAKELGIETATPAELERMKAAWGNQ